MCDCIEELNAKLAERNSRIVEGIALRMSTGASRSYPVIECEKINKRNRDRASVIPTFCPFCGERYKIPDVEPEKAKETAR